MIPSKRVQIWLILAVLVGIALWYKLRIFDAQVIPTYGNTMYHVGIIRRTVESGYYPLEELSYGGGFRSLYVPFYRTLVASMAVATGIDPMPLSALMTVLLSSFTVVAMYALGRRIFNNDYIGLCAAFFFVTSPELTIFTARAFPELLGLLLVPLTLYLISANYRSLAVASAMATALTHQLAFSVLVPTLVLYLIAQVLNRNKSEIVLSIVVLAGAIGAYVLWMAYLVGLPFLLTLLKFTGLVKASPGSPVDWTLLLRAGYAVVVLLPVGLSLFLSSGLRSKPRLLMLAWFTATFLLAKNDLLGVGVLMDRYFTFLVQAMVMIAAFGIYGLFKGGPAFAWRIVQRLSDHWLFH